MGSHTVELGSEKQLSAKQVAELVKDQAAMDTHEYGHNPYSGSWNTCADMGRVRPSNIFNSYDEAWEYLSNKVNKYEYGFAHYLSVDRETVKKDKTLQKIQEQVHQAREKLEEARFKANKAIKEAKSKTIGCSKCESKINRSYLKQPRCPVCGEDLRSETVKKRITSADNKIKELEKRYEERLKYINEKKGKVKTIIVGWAAC